MMEMQRETQLQLMSTIKSIQPKEPQENLSGMGDAQLWEELDKEDRDSERCRMITKLLRDRAIAKATGSTAKTAVPFPKSTSTPNNLFTRVEPIFDVGGETETIAGGGAVSKQLATASPEQKIGAGENVISIQIPHQGDRLKVNATKNVASVSAGHTDEDWISADETTSSTLSSTKANKSTQSPVSHISSEERPKGVGFEGEKGKSCLKNLGRGRIQSTGRSLS